jgi:rhodanese-related sulfurtransferase
MLKKLIIGSALSIGLLFAYNPLDGVKAQKAEALKIVGNNFVTAKTLQKWITEGKVKIVDVRESPEYFAGHIKGAVLIPRGVLYGAVKKGKIKPTQRIVTVCRTGHRALLAAATLKKWYNFKNVYVLKGGMKAWIQNGGTVINAMKLGPVKIELQK